MRLYLAAGVVAIVAVLVCVLVLSVYSQSEDPEDVLEDITRSTNAGNARGVVDHTVHFFSPSTHYEAVVNNTQQMLDGVRQVDIVLSHLNVSEMRYLAEMNDSERSLVTDYAIEYQTRLSPDVDFVADDYCIVSFSWESTMVDTGQSWTLEYEWLFAHIDHNWYVVGNAMGGGWG